MQQSQQPPDIHEYQGESQDQSIDSQSNQNQEHNHQQITSFEVEQSRSPNHTNGEIEASQLSYKDLQNEGNNEIKQQENQAESSKSTQFRQPLYPILNWEPHQEKIFYSEFLDFIESRYQEVKGSQSINKYYAKIGLQIFIYILNILELIFTLTYDSYNSIEEGTFSTCYVMSIVFCVLMHCAVWMYTYKFRQVEKKGIFEEIGYYIMYIIVGTLSYFKVAPFIYFYIRDQSIKQFSFSEINKYLLLEGEDKFRNPSRLFKLRTKPVNIFRDLIFHRVALISMLITMLLQTIPQLFIQGFYNTEKDIWNDGFNVISYMLLIGNLIYYLLELQFIVYTTTYRQMQTELQFKLEKIKAKTIDETKQILNSDYKFIGFVQSFYFHIDPSTYDSYLKKKCMVQIITFLTRQKKFKNIQILFTDEYEVVTLQYLSNCFKLIEIQNISLFYKDQSKLQILESIFNRFELPNITFELQNNQNIEELWTSDKIDPNAEEAKVSKVKIIEQPKVKAKKNTAIQVIQTNQQNSQKHCVKLSKDFTKVIQHHSKNQETCEEIVKDAQQIIEEISKRDIFQENFGRIQCIMTFYDYYQMLVQIQSCEGIISSIQSLFNGSLQVITLVYMSDYSNQYITALVVLTVINPVLQMLTFAIFQNKVFTYYTIKKQVLNTFLFGFINFFKIVDYVIFVLYLFKVQMTEDVKRDFSADGYLKFKSYASKFEGSLPITVFQRDEVKVSGSIFQIKKQPFFQAVMWRADVEEALNKISQFFIYTLAYVTTGQNALYDLSYLQQIKESIYAAKDTLEVVIKDFFIPALILSTVSVEQFFQSMLYLSSVSNQIVLEYPKSFQIMSKVNEIYLKEKCTFKINLEKIDFSNYKQKKKKKMLAQFRQVLASIENYLEIEQTQKLFCMGPEVSDFIRCLSVSPIVQLKLSFYLDEISPSNLPNINDVIRLSPKNLELLHISVESSENIPMQINVGRKDTLKVFCYSYSQIKLQYKDATQEIQQPSLNINQSFLKLDRYDFQQLQIEVTGKILLNECESFFTNFTQLKTLKLNLNNNIPEIQTFSFSNNIKSYLENLDFTFENIKLDFQQFPFGNLNIFKLVLRRCDINLEELKKILQTLNMEKTTLVYIDISQCEARYSVEEQAQLLRMLESQKIDATIKI